MLIVDLAAGLLTQFFPCCAFAIRSFSKVSATPEHASVSQGRICSDSLTCCHTETEVADQTL